MSAFELLTIRTSKIPFEMFDSFGRQNQRDVILRKRIIRVSSFDLRNKILQLASSFWVCL